MVPLLPRDHSRIALLKGFRSKPLLDGGCCDNLHESEKSLLISGMDAELMEVMGSLMSPDFPKALADFSIWRCPHILFS